MRIGGYVMDTDTYGLMSRYRKDWSRPWTGWLKPRTRSRFTAEAVRQKLEQNEKAL